MRREDIVEANRLAWNEAEAVHRGLKFDEWSRGFSAPGHSTLDALITERLRGLGLAGKTVYQLCCNNGREVLSMLNLGAARGVGFDVSDAFIAQARELTSLTGLNAEFVRTDVLAIGPEWDGGADLIYVSIGAMTWLPELDPFFAVAARLLRPGGHLVIYESHPLLGIFEIPTRGDDPILQNNYFETRPSRYTDGLDYWSHQPYESQPMYCYQHTLTTILGGILRAGLTLRAFEEYPHDISTMFEGYEQKLGVVLPACYQLVAQRG